MAREVIPSVSMSRKAKFVTQSGVYDTFYLGKLTDRKIKAYALAGKYGDEAKRRAEESKPIKRAKLVRRTSTKREDLLALLLA